MSKYEYREWEQTKEIKFVPLYELHEISLSANIRKCWKNMPIFYKDGELLVNQILYKRDYMPKINIVLLEKWSL